ncbi:MAG TPA: glycosyltransferase family 39 protein [Terriglobales bacterium]|nr:glycosyltransferase family 39 protein [Terriglobales bacterium]
MNGRTVRELATLAAFCVFLFFFGLGSFGLVGPDEPRYAQVAREMAERHDWVTPTLHGEAWLEKPILYYWRARIAYALFGVSDWPARLPSATFATLMIAAVYVFTRRFRPGGELEAALITASSAGVIGFSRAAATDMELAAPFTAGMLAWYAWHATGRRLWLAAFYFFLAVGTLAKGPVAPGLALLILMAYAGMRRDVRLLRRTLWLPGVLLFLMVAVPWYVAVQMVNPQFFRVFLLEHNLARFATDLYRHKQPFWFYVPVLILGLAPWTAIAGASLVGAMQRGRLAWKERGETRDPLPLFLASWAVVPVVFFSLSQSKLPGYILPALPAWGLLAADLVWRRQREGKRLGAGLLWGHALVLGVIAGALPLVPFVLQRPPQPVEAWSMGVAAGVGVVVLAAALVTLRRYGLPMLRFVTLVPVVLTVAFLVRVEALPIDRALSSRPVAAELEQLGTAGKPVAGFRIHRNLEYGLGFYRNQKVQRYERGEIPAEDHLLIVRKGTREEAAKLAGGRRFSRIGDFGAQGVEFYWVSSSTSLQHEK